MYACQAFQPDGITCAEWVEVSTLMPALSVSDGQALGVAVLLVAVTAWAASIIVTMLINRS